MKYIMVILLVGLVVLSACAKQEVDVLDINLREHKNLALHIHPTVKITINGEDQAIPANMGISNTGMRVIHTHDSSGKLHIESPFPHQFYLEDFFTIWNKNFNETCIFDYCEDETHNLKVYVNGIETDQGGDTLFMDRDLIEIEYGQLDE